MAHPTEPSKALLIVAIMYKDDMLKESALKQLKKKYGEPLKSSETYDFNFTDYYEDEFGTDLLKQIFVFEKFDITSLPEVKLWSNSLEEKLSKKHGRDINIDPGYLTKDALILATCKPRPSRVYLEKGVYAHLTLLMKKNGCESLQWTFADYKKMAGFFSETRKELLV